MKAKIEKDGSFEFEGEPEDVAQCVAILRGEKQLKVAEDFDDVEQLEVENKPEQPLQRKKIKYKKRKTKKTVMASGKIGKLEKAKKLYEAGASIYTAYQKAFKLNYKAGSSQIKEFRDWMASGKAPVQREANNGAKIRMLWVQKRIKKLRKEKGWDHFKALKRASKDYNEKK